MTRATRTSAPLRAALVLALAGLLLTAPGEARQAPVIELPLSPYVANLRTVLVTIGNQTAPFVFDTGGGFTVFTPEFARAMECAPFGRVTGFRSSGERIDMARCGPVTLKLGPKEFSGEVGIFDLMSLLKGAPPVSGIIALETLRATPFTLDLAGGRLVFETPQSLAQRVKGMSAVSVRASRQGGGAALDLFLEVTAPRGPLWLEIDSGNVGPVLLSPHAITQLRLGPTGERPRKVTLDVRGLGPVPVEVETKDLIYDGLLNAAFLEGVVFTVDLATGRAWAAARK